MLIHEKAVLGVCCSYYQYNHINSDLAFTFTFVTHSGHFLLKKVKLDCFPPEYKGLTWLIFSSYHNSYHM